jgi:4-hydroxy-3-methylbut-2-enyl diphosphate reductase IspH
MFVAFKNELPEDKSILGESEIVFEPISGDFLEIAHKFENSNIFAVTTNRGCSCDFGIEKNYDPRLIEVSETTKRIEEQKSLVRKIMKWFGKEQLYIKRRIDAAVKYREDDISYFNQTLDLIKVINTNTTQTISVELYSCWFGEYSEAAESTKVINLDKENLENYFVIEPREKIIFIRG